MMKRPTYFVSKNRKTLVTILAGTTTIGLFLVNYVPHTFGLDQYRAFVQCNRNGEAVPVSSKVIERLNKAKDLLQFSSLEKDLIKPFTVFGFDIFAAGSTKSKCGGVIGIPSNYQIDNVDDLKKETICYQGNKIDWDSTAGKLLEEALILNEDEQIFGMCKALLQVQNYNYLLNSVFPTISFFMVYSVGNYLNSSLGLLSKPFSLRLCMYTILGLFGFGSWSFMKDYNQVTKDTEIDIKLSAMSPKMIEGGVGYYNKQLNKNIALREIANNNTYTAKGNCNYFLRQKSLPLTLRKSYFEEKHTEYLKTLN